MLHFAVALLLAVNAQLLPLSEASQLLAQVRQYLRLRYPERGELQASPLFLATFRSGRHQCSWPRDEWDPFPQNASQATPEYDVRTTLALLDAKFDTIEQFPLFAKTKKLKPDADWERKMQWHTFPPAEDATLFWDERKDEVWLRFNFLQVRRVGEKVFACGHFYWLDALKGDCLRVQ